MVYIDCCTLFMKNPTVNDKVNIGFIGVSEDGEHQRERAYDVRFRQTIRRQLWLVFYKENRKKPASHWRIENELTKKERNPICIYLSATLSLSSSLLYNLVMGCHFSLSLSPISFQVFIMKFQVIWVASKRTKTVSRN